MKRNPAISLGGLVERLSAAGCVAAEEEAAELVAAAADAATLEGWLVRREQGEPLAWIVGSLEFCGRTVRVGPGVYVPRFQTEELARRAAAALAVSGGGRAADLCTGCGAVAHHVQAEVPTATVIGVDVDEVAARWARSNGVPTVVDDLGACFRAGSFDVVTAVAPYVPTAEMQWLPADVQRYEPSRALDGGPDGLRLVRAAVRQAAQLLRQGGWLFTEVGGDQDRALGAAMAESGFGPPTTWHDDDGDLRGLAAQLGAGRA